MREESGEDLERVWTNKFGGNVAARESMKRFERGRVFEGREIMENFYGG